MKFTALSAFENLQHHSVFTFEKLEQWLLNFEADYKDLKYNWHCPKLGCSHKFTGHCTCVNPDDIALFLNLYRQLLEFSLYQNLEDYARSELERYQQVKNNTEKMKQWVIKNESIAVHDCFEFLMNYYSYHENPQHLLVADKELLGYQVFVETMAFRNLIQFLQLFDELFWIQKIYPESEILCFSD